MRPKREVDQAITLVVIAAARVAEEEEEVNAKDFIVQNVVHYAHTWMRSSRSHDSWNAKNAITFLW